MTSKNRPETIENRWDLLYSDYPEVYQEWTQVPRFPGGTLMVCTAFDLRDSDVVDLGSGTGSSTFRIAEYARRVIGVEPEAAMRELAQREALSRGFQNIEFIEGSSDRIPIPASSVDAVVAITAPMNVTEAERVLRPGGLLVQLGVTPGWYGGELDSVIGDTNVLAETSEALIKQGFDYLDYDALQDYGSTENILRTYGFIFGRRAIDHLRRTGQTKIRWRYRIHFRRQPT